MPSKTHVQTDFSGGVVDRRIEGRTDSARYDKTMRQAENFVVTRSGTLRRRPGTVYIGDAFRRGGSDAANNVSIDQDFRLVPWDTSDGKRSLLAISKTMVSLYENELPGVGVTGLGTTARFTRPQKPEVGQPQSNRVSYDRHLDDSDAETILEQTALDTTTFFDTDLNNLRTVPIGDTCYIAPEGYQLHCCVKDRFYSENTGNPDTVEGTENGLYNMPVSYIDGPYAFTASTNEPTTRLNFGPLFSSRFKPSIIQNINQQFINFTEFPGVSSTAKLPYLIDSQNDSTVNSEKRFGAPTCMRLTTHFASTAENQDNIYTNLKGLEVAVAKHYDLAPNVTKQELVDAINSNISAEHPCCYEQADADGKVKRFSINVYGAFKTGEVGGAAWTLSSSDVHAAIDGSALSEDFVILLCRITNIEGHDSEDVGNYTASTHPYYEGASTGLGFKARGTLSWGINVDKGVRAIHETQDRLGVVFEDEPSRVFYTRTSGFSIFSNKNNIDTNEFGQLQPLTVTAGGTSASFPQHLRSRCYVDFGIGLISDTRSFSSSDGFDVLPDGLNGSKINHLKTMFDGVIIFAERGTALLRGGSSRALDALSFVSRKINDEGSMRSCEPQDVESGIVYVDSTGSKLFYLQPASNADTSLSSQDVSYTSKNLLTPDATTVGGRTTPPVATVHRSMSLVTTPLNQARICRSDGKVINFSIDTVGQFYAFTSFTQKGTLQYEGKFLNYAQLVSRLGGYVFISNLANRSVINGLTRVGEILRETVDVDQGSDESLICMDRMGILVETNDKPPDPDDGGGDDSEFSRLGLVATLPDPSGGDLVVAVYKLQLALEDAEGFLETGDKVEISVNGPTDFEEIKKFGFGINVEWDLVYGVVLSETTPQGQRIVEVKLTSDDSLYGMSRDSSNIFENVDVQNNMKVTKINDSGGLFLSGKSLASFPHLANEVATVSKDGVEIQTTLDSAGATSLSITEDYEKFIGLNFDSIYESMPLQRLARLSTADDSRITLKRIYRAFLKVIRSVGGRVNGRSIEYTEGEAVAVNGRYDGIVEHGIDATHKIEETLTMTNGSSNMLEVASIVYEVDSGGVS